MSVENTSVKSMPLSAQGIYIYIVLHSFPTAAMGFLTIVAPCLLATPLFDKYYNHKIILVGKDF